MLKVLADFGTLVAFKELQAVLEPFIEVVCAVQRDTATLADCLRYHVTAIVQSLTPLAACDVSVLSF